jgi:BA14K-like protein
MFTFSRSAMLSAIVALGVSFGSTAGAMATAVAPAIDIVTPVQNNLLQEAKVNISIGIGQGYDRFRHGRRCNFRHDYCRNYYGGYYYQNPWWLLPGIGAGHIIQNNNGYQGYSSNHVRWCQDHYRSYNRRTNTWLSYGGQHRQCNSPY